MQVTLVPSSVSDRSENQHQFLSSFIINDYLAVDAGCLGYFGSVHEQARIKHVLITHTHIDHIGSLPIFVENAYQGGGDCVTIYASAEALDCLQKDIFNNRVWPDFINLSKDQAPFLRVATLQADKPIQLEGLRITPVPVNHVVPTFGYIIEDPGAAIVIASDTGPTEAIWDKANATPNLKAVFMEATFPESLGWLAEASKHLTTGTFGREMQKLKTRVTFVAVHIKARYQAEVIKELKALGHPDLQLAQFAKPYSF